MKEKTEQEQDFLKLYDLVGKDLTQFKKRLEKSSLAPSQVKILWGYHAYRKRELEKALGTLKAVTVNSSLIEGARLYLLGLTYNHFGKFAFAREHLNNAREKLNETDTDHFKILNLATLLFCYGNQSIIEPMAEIMDEMEKIKPANEYEKMLKVLCKATYLSDSGQYEKANKYIDNALVMDSEYLPVFEAGFRLLKINIFFKLEKTEKCYQALDEYNKSTGFKCNSNFRFIKFLLDHIVHRQTLYVYKYDFEDSQEQYDQLMVIKALSEDDPTGATKYWKLLQKHNPEIYSDDFIYRGDAVFFKVALKQNLERNESKLDIHYLQRLKTIQEKLEYIFEEGPEKIKKERLIQLLWGEEDGPEARTKLRRALQYFQQKNAIKFKSYQDCYQKIKKAS